MIDRSAAGGWRDQRIFSEKTNRKQSTREYTREYIRETIRKIRKMETVSSNMHIFEKFKQEALTPPH